MDVLILRYQPLELVHQCYRQKLKHQDSFIWNTYSKPFSGQISFLVLLHSTTCQFFPKWPVVRCKYFCVSGKADWHDETVSWLLEMVIEKWENIFQVTDAAGCSLCWKKKSTHYVRAIAVFKISLTLCVIHLSCFWMEREGGSQEEGGEDWLVVIYKHCVLWLPFPRLKHKKRLVTRCVFFFFTPAFSLRFFLQVHTLKASQHSPFSLSYTETHTQNQCMHTHTQALLGYWTAIAVRSLL